MSSRAGQVVSLQRREDGAPELTRRLNELASRFGPAAHKEARALEGLDQREQELVAQVAELEAELAQLRAERERVESEVAQMERERLIRMRELVGEALRSQRALVVQRSDLLEAALIERYRRAEGRLAALPLTRRGRPAAPYWAGMEPEEPWIEARPEELHVVAAIESDNDDQGRRQVLAMALVLPVPATVHRDWVEVGDALEARLAWRLIAALAGALLELGVPDAPIRYLEMEGALCMQVWLGDSPLYGDVGRTLTDAVERLGDEAGELAAVNLSLSLVWVEPGLLEGADHAA
jgi:cell division protein FtsB